MREVGIDLARMDRAALAHEPEDLQRALFTPGGPRQAAFRGNPGVRSRMHECLHLARDKTVVDEEIFFDVGLRVASFQVAGAIAFDPVTQDEVLRPRGSANRIRLYETHLVQRS